MLETDGRFLGLARDAERLNADLTTTQRLRRKFDVVFENSKIKKEREKHYYLPQGQEQKDDGSLSLKFDDDNGAFWQVVLVAGSYLKVQKTNRISDETVVEKIEIDTRIGSYRYYKGPDCGGSDGEKGKDFVQKFNNPEAERLILGFIPTIP